MSINDKIKQNIKTFLNKNLSKEISKMSAGQINALTTVLETASPMTINKVVWRTGDHLLRYLNR